MSDTPVGGIQRYMEAFPDGGFFMGRNFVFDERVTVASKGGKIVGRCLTCSAPHDTYEPRRRCQHCRMLVLVCPTCAAKVRFPYQPHCSIAHHGGDPMKQARASCESCQRCRASITVSVATCAGMPSMQSVDTVLSEGTLWDYPLS